MKVMIFIVVSLLLTILLYLTSDGVSAGQIAHNGWMVNDSGDPSECIVCHDGSTASIAHYCTVDCSVVTPHSIMKDYPPVLKEDSYAPVKSLEEKGIRLFNGKLGCVSCHDLKKTKKSHLIMDNAGSALCFSCHLI